MCGKSLLDGLLPLFIIGLIIMVIAIIVHFARKKKNNFGDEIRIYKTDMSEEFKALAGLQDRAAAGFFDRISGPAAGNPVKNDGFPNSSQQSSRFMNTTKPAGQPEQKPEPAFIQPEQVKIPAFNQSAQVNGAALFNQPKQTSGAAFNQPAQKTSGLRKFSQNILNKENVKNERVKLSETLDNILNSANGFDETDIENVLNGIKTILDVEDDAALKASLSNFNKALEDLSENKLALALYNEMKNLRETL